MGDAAVRPGARAADNRSTPVLQAQSITLAFGAVQALSDVSVDIYPGEILAIIGPNGAGKTSLLNVINGMYRPQRGRIVFKGVEWSKRLQPYQVARQGIARTFQNLALFKGMSTLDNLMTGRALHMRTGLLSQALYWGRARRDEERQRAYVEHASSWAGR
jgi:branched-chain amino acid transport system ATP-binding protein